MGARIKGAAKIRYARWADEYAVVPANNNTAIGTTGNVGDYLESLVCIVSNAANAGVILQDGAVSIGQVLPNAVNGANIIPIPLGISAVNGQFRVLTNAGVNVVATGIFSTR